MSGVICSSACFVLMGGGRLELGIVQGNVALKKKEAISAPCFSIAHACRHLHVYYRHRNAYG